MHRYDPERAPDGLESLAMDEQTRMDLVADYHRRARIKVPDREMHVAVHVIVENQIAEGHAPASGDGAAHFGRPDAPCGAARGRSGSCRASV